MSCVDIHEGRYEAGWRRLALVFRSQPADSFTALLLVAMSAFVGKPEAARSVAAQLIDVDPLQPINHYVAGFFRYACEDGASALPLVARGYELDPLLTSGINLYAQVLAAAGQVGQAKAVIARANAAAPEDNLAWLTALFGLALDGRRMDIERSLTPERIRWARTDLQYSLQLAECFAMTGDRDRAFDWLENAIAHGVVNYPFLSARDPFLGNLRDDPRFLPLMARVKEIWLRL